jgi:protein TonB
MTTIHFPLDFPLPANAPSTVAWKHVQPLRLDGHALGGTPPDDRRLKYTPVSIAMHAAVLAAFILGPLLGDLKPPDPALGVRAFFTEPGILAAPPPPPPPPVSAPRAAMPPKAPPPVASANAFVAPVEIPDQIARPSLSVGETGVAGGVEGGVEGGVAGGIVGGLPAVIAPLEKPRPQAVRVGGAIREPKRLVYVPPEYPLIASQARVTGMVILEARVGTDGHVLEANVLRGQPLFDEPAKAAVMQWRYQPLLLNGVAMEFILTVTVQFSIRAPE